MRRRVVVGDEHAVDVGDRRLHRLARRLDRGHRAELGAFGPGGIDDEAAARRRERHQRLEVDRAAGEQGDELAVAVAGEHVRRDAERLHQPEHRHLDRAERGLGDVGGGQRLARAGLVVLAVGGAREDEAAEPRRLAEALRRTARAARASASDSVSAQTGKCSASSRSMPVYCDPWPGKRTASLPGAAARTP